MKINDKYMYIPLIISILISIICCGCIDDSVKENCPETYKNNEILEIKGKILDIKDTSWSSHMYVNIDNELYLIHETSIPSHIKLNETVSIKLKYNSYDSFDIISILYY